jgi:hypothetical protein
MRALVVAVALSGCNHPPQRDVFIPPYAQKGCWARLYEQPQFAGAMRQLEGPVFIESIGARPVIVPDAEHRPPQPLFSQIGSLVVGPHARLVGYAAPLFREPRLQIPPGAQVPDVSAIGFYDRVESLTLACEADAGEENA